MTPKKPIAQLTVPASEGDAGTHVPPVASAMAAGVSVGAALGMVAGIPGMVVGAVAGGVAAGLAGEVLMNAAEDNRKDTNQPLPAVKP